MGGFERHQEPDRRLPGGLSRAAQPRLLAAARVAMALVLLAAVPLVCASLLILFGGQVERAVLRVDESGSAVQSVAWVWALVSRMARYCWPSPRRWW